MLNILGIGKKADQERGEYLSVTQLMVRRFKRHMLARVSLVGLVILYTIAILGSFVAPYDANPRFKGFTNAPPTTIHFVDEDGTWIGPTIYKLEKTVDPETFKSTYEADREQGYPIRLFVRGDEYKVLGLLTLDWHLFGVKAQEIPMALCGTDEVGRDILSRIIIGARVSMFIGLVGVTISFVLGCLIGGISGYFGGLVDEVIQRFIDLLICIPTIPLWIALSAAIPREWSVVQTYFAITVVLAVVGWTGLARVVRGKLLSLRDIDFVIASRISGGSDMFVIIAHLLPNFMSYLIVSITNSIPSMILAETALSFIGVGMQEPAVSWGVLLQETMNFTALVHYPWKLIPVIPVILVVLMYNAVGDGLRDAADPYSL